MTPGSRDQQGGNSGLTVEVHMFSAWLRLTESGQAARLGQHWRWGSEWGQHAHLATQEAGMAMLQPTACLLADSQTQKAAAGKRNPALVHWTLIAAAAGMPVCFAEKTRTNLTAGLLFEAQLHCYPKPAGRMRILLLCSERLGLHC